MCAMEGGAAFIRVDVGCKAFAPDRSRPSNVIVRVTLRNPTETSLTTSTEAGSLGAFEEALVAAIPDAPLVGVVTNAGHRSWFLYAADRERAERAALDVAAKALPEHSARVDHFEDPEWYQYLEFLYPNDLAWQWIADRRVLDALNARGDDGTRPRTISHWAYFPRRRDRRAFARRIVPVGYRVLEKRSVPRDTAGHPFGLRFESAGPTAPIAIFPMTERLFLLARECGGKYDGWECPVEGPSAS